MRTEKFKKMFPDAKENGTAEKLWELAWSAGVRECINTLDAYSKDQDAQIRAYVLNLMAELEYIE